MSVVHLGPELVCSSCPLGRNSLTTTQNFPVIQDWPKQWKSISREDSGGSWRCQLSSASRCQRIYIKESACSVQFGINCLNSIRVKFKFNAISQNWKRIQWTVHKWGHPAETASVRHCQLFAVQHKSDQRKRRLCEVWTEPERPVPEEEFGWVERSWEFEWEGFKTVAAAGVLQRRSQCQNVVGKPKLSKYILKFGQIRLAIWTNTLHGKVNTVRQLHAA